MSTTSIRSLIFALLRLPERNRFAPHPTCGASLPDLRRTILTAVFFASLALAAVGLRDRSADACGFSDDLGIAGSTTFDPAIVGEDDGLAYDPDHAGFGDGCSDCRTKAIAADWKGYLGEAASGDFLKLMFEGKPHEVIAIANRLAGSPTAVPPPWDKSPLLAATGAAKTKLAAAVAYLQLANRVEPFASFAGYDSNGNQRPPSAPPDDVVRAARAGLKTADGFLAQRYAYQLIRAVFYRRDWNGVITQHGQLAKLLAGPSRDLAWRARNYLAGAHARSGKKSAANVELAHIHAGYPPLATEAANAFLPMEDRDFRDALQLAATPAAKVELWRMVGLRNDGLVAAKEIAKLDAKSPLIALLIVRELERAESRAVARYGGQPTAQDIAAQRKAYAALDQLASELIAKGADRPHILELVRGHLAAKRGDLVSTKAHAERALAAQPNNGRVISQAAASTALAVVASWTMSPANEATFATTFARINKDFQRFAAVRQAVRSGLAAHYAKANRTIDAEFLSPGQPTAKWVDRKFIEDMIARSRQTATAFDRFVVENYPQPVLERELAMRHLLDGNFTAATALFKTGRLASEQLHTDPFVIHIKDCHDCDHEKYDNAPWTHANFVARLAELEVKARAGGASGADAAVALGNALYNVTRHGNARIVLADTHQATADASAALAWYKRAYDLAPTRQLKAKTAFLAAKAELGTALARDPDREWDAPLPVPKTWFATLKLYSDTQYYREVLAECGHFARWAKKNK